MLEILFHGKRIDNGEWVEGYYAGYGLICPNEPESTYNATGDYYGQTPYVGFVEVDPATVGQYTGLKDKNGKRIFEGDIVVYPDSTSYSSYDDYNEGVVDYDEEVMRFYFSNRWFVEMEDFDVVDGMMVDVAVIGNIHDNPELLEVR